MFTSSRLRAGSALQRLRTSVSVRFSSLFVAGLACAFAFVLAGCGGGSSPSTPSAPAAAAPVFTPGTGSFSAVQAVTMSDATAGATIYYTTDGSIPTTSSAKYSAALTVASTQTVSAIAAASNYSNSAVASATYTIVLPPAPTPTFSLAAGVYTSAQTVSLADSSASAVIYYTTDGSTPTTASAKYTTPLTISATTTVNAIATVTGNSNSAVASSVYTINLPAAPAPAFSLAAGTYTSIQTVSLSDSIAGAAIFYTVDGSAPTVNSARYTAPLTVSTTTTVNAIAIAAGYNSSPVASGTFTINLPAAAMPTFSPVAGTYTSVQTVSIADATAGAVIYYTVDGSTPTTASAKFVAPLTVSTTTTIRALATANGYNSSAVATGAFVINLPPAATPTFSPAPGTYTSVQTVSIADATAGVTIYYTLDGSTPTPSSTKYTVPITVSVSETINAIATATGFAQSATGTAAYIVNLPTAATPTFSPAGGNYTTSQTVTLSDSTAGTVIYYTLDGSTPTPASNVYSAPLVVSATTTIHAIATATGYLQSAVGTATYTIAASNPAVAVTLTKYDSSLLLAAQTPTVFGTGTVNTASDQLIIDENQQFQTVDGFGAAFTDASAYNLEEVELSSQLPGTLSDLFTRTGNGIGLSFMLSPMGASDESKTIYTYDDIASGTDTALSSFSVAHDTAYIIPLIQAAKTLNPSLKYLATPWSPPAWMKIGQSIEGGTLNTSYYSSFANYFIKYLQAYQTYGILPDYIAMQNEPLNPTTAYPSMGMDEPTQLIAIRDYMLPALTSSGLSTKVMLYDHNWDQPSYPYSLLSDPTILASPVVAGTAWHGYGGPAGAELGTQNSFPTKGNWETEFSDGTFTTGNLAISDFNLITLVMRSSSKSYIKWNLALDQNRGPNTTQLKNSAGTAFGGCNTCSPIVTVNSSTGLPTKTIEFYTLGQYSKFILPGAVRVYSSDTPTIVSSAYINPDGSRALVAFNNSFGDSTFQVEWGTKNFSYTLPAYTAATFTWSGTQSGAAVAQSATQQIQGANFTTATGVEVEETTDDTGSYDIGYVTDGATMYYKNVSFGTGVSTVNVRVASNGNGGTIEFHLDSATGTLLGTAKLPNTGGYQTWQTVNTPVSTATGTHDLYMVIHGSGGIGNVNWFQFQ